MTASSPIVLEPAAQQVADAFSKPPFLYEMAPADARKVLEDAQSAPVSKPPVDEEWIMVPAPVGDARVRIIKPPVEAGGAAKLERTPTLTNDSVVELVEAGFSEGTIVRRIEQSPVEFDLAPAKLAELRKRRVGEPVINAMRAAMGEDAKEPARPEK